MEIIVISAVALAVSALTFFSGFGLGTLLMPVFIIFFPIETAIALTAVVHLLNNILKTSLLFKKASLPVILKFGITAFIFAYLGARTLLALENIPPIHSYQLFDRTMNITTVKLTISLLITIFVIIELHPILKKINLSQKWLPLGGAASGYFGGLSGHQGALRSMFLLKTGLSKDTFIATNVIIACMVDLSRIPVYYKYVLKSDYKQHLPLMISAILSAFVGVFIGRLIMKKITMKTVRLTVSAMLILIAILLAAGII